MPSLKSSKKVLRKKRMGTQDLSVADEVKEEEEILDFFNKEDAAQQSVALIDFPLLKRSAATIGSSWNKKSAKRLSKYKNF